MFPQFSQQNHEVDDPFASLYPRPSPEVSPRAGLILSLNNVEFCESRPPHAM
jgi:hypothetical protein